MNPFHQYSSGCHARVAGPSAAGSANETSERRLAERPKFYVYILMVDPYELIYDIAPPCPHPSSTGQKDVELTEMSNDDDEEAGAPLISDCQTSKATDRNPTTEATVSPNPFIWVMACTSAISGILFGYDTGVISSTLVSVGSDLSSRPLNTLDKSLITSSTSFFALISSPIAGVLADHLGRKRVILLADILFVFGAMIQALARNVAGMVRIPDPAIYPVAISLVSHCSINVSCNSLLYLRAEMLTLMSSTDCRKKHHRSCCWNG